MSTSQAQTVIGATPYLELYNHNQRLRFDLTQDRHVLGRDQAEADLLLPEDWQLVSRCHAVLCRLPGEPDYQIYDGNQHKPSTNGLFLDRTRITPTEGLRLKDGLILQIGQNPQTRIDLKYLNPLNARPVVTGPGVVPVSLTQGPVEIGRDDKADLRLESPTISRHHATVAPDGKGGYVLHDHSANGVYINGQRVIGSRPVPEGAAIRIGPFTLVVQQHRLSVLDQGSQLRLEAQGLVRRVPVGKGKTKLLLDHISLAIEPGQLVGLVGGSGAGKSTLMRTLLGISPLTEGQVLLNGDDLQRNFALYRAQIGYVPQDDIVHRHLTVREVLTYAAQLRLPPDADGPGLIQRTLADVEMTQYQEVRVSALSGGQRKRVSIAVELLSDPRLFFLDEPTSGLDPGLDKKMMQLLRKLADQGRSIILVTHATANINLCDRIAFLGRGGCLCYFGPPQDALAFFGVDSGDFADIYTALEQGPAVVQQWADRFQQSSEYQRYVAHHLSAGNLAANRGGPPKASSHNPLGQLQILTQRYLKLMGRDPVSVGLGLTTAALCPALMALAVTQDNPLVTVADPEPVLASLALRVLFVFSCAGIWVGLSSALQEIVKEAAIYLRERLVNLGLFPYLGSKVLGLGGLAVIQALLITGVVLISFRGPTESLIWWPLGLGFTTLLTLGASLSLGLLVSALVQNGSQANSALPLLLVPQIIFSGVLFDLDGIPQGLSWLMISRWSVGAYGAIADVNAMIPDPVTLPTGETLPQPITVSLVYDPTWDNLWLNWGMLGLHLSLYLGLTLWLQKRKDLL
jgi:ABC-type multidrug transport system ATPase subunit/pSer/pThr/pTyr-binding forkhead associated (FHA) protein/ABC-type multidrug transport system permease subunit